MSSLHLGCDFVTLLLAQWKPGLKILVVVVVRSQTSCVVLSHCFIMLASVSVWPLLNIELLARVVPARLIIR